MVRNDTDYNSIFLILHIISPGYKKVLLSMEDTLETIIDTIADYEVKHAENQALLAKQTQQQQLSTEQQQHATKQV